MTTTLLVGDLIKVTLGDRARRFTLFAGSFAVALAFYLPRTYRSLATMGDSAELVSAAAVWGVPHPPGYPLYTLLTHTFAQLPWGELPWRVHLTSALFHAATVGIVACLIELITKSRAAALAGASTLALGHAFLQGSLYAEVFPLADLFFAWLLFLALKMPGEGGTKRATLDGNGGQLWLLGISLGVGLGHHYMLALSLPALGFLSGKAFVRYAGQHPARTSALAVVSAASMWAPYAAIPRAASRRPLVSWGDVHDLDSLVHLMARQDYGGMFAASRGAAHGQWLERLDLLASSVGTSLGMVGLVWAAIGIVSGFSSDRRATTALVIAFITTGPVFAALNSFDIHSEYRVAFFGRFTTMCLVPMSVLVGLGAGRVASMVRTRGRLLRWPAHRATPALLAALPPMLLLPRAWALDFSGDRQGIIYAHDLVEGTPDRSLLLLKGDLPSQAALYVCAVEHRCGARIILSPGQLFMPWKIAQVRERYPELALPSRVDPATIARWLVRREVSWRPVFVHPEIVDDALAPEMSAVPGPLLYRIYPSDEIARMTPLLRSELSDLVGGPCEGCSSGDVQISAAYRSTSSARTIAAGELGLTDAATPRSTVSRDSSGLTASKMGKLGHEPDMALR